MSLKEQDVNTIAELNKTRTYLRAKITRRCNKIDGNISSHTIDEISDDCEYLENIS